MNYPHVFGKYVLLERLGIGGMSEVDLARQRMGEGDFVRFVVIKRVKTDRTSDESFIRMFKDEARITSELHHAGIGQVYDFGREGDEYFLALEYVAGLDLRAIVNAVTERGERVPLRFALRIIADVLDALSYAHNKRDALGKPMGIVHRDVNPRNIMVSIHGETKLIDFGVAKATNRLEHTKTDHVKGKFSYMAPEQVKGEPLDGRADLFALALTFHELLSGSSAFHGLNHVQIVHRLLHAQLPQLPELSEMPDDRLLRAFHKKSLARKREDRYADAAAMRRDLDQVAAAIGGLPTQEELATFLQMVSPDLTARVHHKMERYSGDLDTLGVAAAPPVLDSSLSGTIRPPAAGDASQTITIISTPAAVVLSLGFLVPVISVGLLLLVALGVYALVSHNTPAKQTIASVQPIGPTVPPKPAEPAAPEPATAKPTVPEPAALAPEPSPKPQNPKPTRSVPVPAPVAPVPEPVEPEPDPEPEMGQVSVSGEASSVEFRGTGEAHVEGPIPVGSYVIWAAFAGDPVRAGSVKIGPGAQVGVRCVAAFKRCVVE